MTKEKPSCRWVKTPHSDKGPAVYCGKPVRYTMPKDDDQNRHRKYEFFCDEHLKQAQEDDSWDE